MSKSKIQLRWLLRRDMSEVMEIEDASFGFCWSEEDFLRSLRNRHITRMVAELDDEVVGFIIYSLHKKHLKILNVAVDPDSRRRGVGTAIVSCLFTKMKANRRDSIHAGVRESNLDAQLFFKACGFKACGVDRSGYEDPKEDCYLFKFTTAVDQDEIHRYHPKNRVASYLSEPNA